jgi:hypothetical protein
MNFQASDNLIFGAIGALTAIFFCAFILLLFICFQYQKRRLKFQEINESDSLYGRATAKKTNGNHSKHQELSLVDIGLGNALEQVIFKLDKQWTLDKAYSDYDIFIPICLDILKKCHSLTDRLTTILLGSKNLKLSGSRIVEISKRIPERLDDIVRSIYPTLDAALLEARTSNLILAVGQLAILAKHSMANNKSHNLNWIDDELNKMELQLMVI